MSQNDTLNFDRNDFIRKMCDTSFRSHFHDIFNVLADRSRDSWRFQERYKEANGIRDDEHLAQTVKWCESHNDSADADLYKMTYFIYKNPDKSAEFLKFWNMAGCLFENWSDTNIQKYRAIMSQINTFDEENRMYIFYTLEWEAQKYDKELYESIMVNMAKNKLATLGDRVRIAEAFMDKNHNFVREAVDQAKQELNDELKATSMDTEKINDICNRMTWFMKSLKEQLKNRQMLINNFKEKVPPIENELNLGYVDEVTKIFDKDKAIQIGAEYVAKVTNSIEERLGDAEQRADFAEKTLQRVTDVYKQADKQNGLPDKFSEDLTPQQHADKVVDETQKLVTANGDLMQQNTKLSEDLGSEKKKNSLLTATLNAQKKDIENMTAIIEALQAQVSQMKTGFGSGKSVKELQDSFGGTLGKFGYQMVDGKLQTQR